MIQNLGTFSLFDKRGRYVHVRIDLDGSKLAAFAAEAANRIASGEHLTECSAITVTVEEDEVQDEVCAEKCSQCGDVTRPLRNYHFGQGHVLPCCAECVTEPHADHVAQTRGKVTDHTFAGFSSTCDYPADHWHPENRSEPTEATSEVCGLAEDEHVS